MRRLGLLFVFALAGWLSEITGYAAIPEWLAVAARLPNPPGCGAADAAILFNQERLVVAGDGTLTTVRRVAFRLLTQKGETAASASVSYLDRIDRVRTTSAWLIRFGKSVDLGQNKWLDVAAVSYGSLFDEYRVKSIDLSPLAQPNDVFGYEIRVDRHPLFAQFFHSFSSSLPAASEQFILEVPPQWAVTIDRSNATALVSSVSPDRRTWSWERRNRPFRPDEPWAAPTADQDPAVYGSYAPPPNSKVAAGETFHSWGEVAAWQEQLSRSQCDTDPALQEKVRQLVSGCTDTLSKIRALCRYAQTNVSYIAINRDIGIGFGYRPRKATEIAAKGYGDCKDKVNVLRALLREIGVPSHPLSVNAYADALILPVWPSPMQFNHAVIGIEVDATIQLPSVISDSPCGRLLLFDPTDASTPLGGLPFNLQGSKAAIDLPDCDRLIDLPILPAVPDQMVVRTVQLQLAPAGGATGHYTIVSRGQRGARIRSWLRNATPRDLHERAAATLADTLGGAQVKNVIAKDDPDHDSCQLESEFSTATYAQRMPGSLELVRLDVLSRGDLPMFSEKTRETAVRLRAIEQRDEVILELPAGCAVEEHPADVVIESTYGRYSGAYEVTAGRIIFRRSFSLRSQQVPPTDYAALRKFLSNAAKADQAAILLKIG